MTLSKYKRLVTAGCSFTAGEGLSNPAVESWPASLAKQLNLECVNLGHSGASNEFIINNVIKYFLSNDPKNCLLIIAYSNLQRLTLGYYNDDNKLVHLTANSKKWPNLSKTIYPEFTNELQNLRKLFLDIMKIQSWLEKKEIDYIMVNGICLFNRNHLNDDETKYYYDIINGKNLINFENTDFTVIIQDGKLPDGHPNKIGHQRIADKLYEWIFQKDTK